ncbi:hypothetical protein [Streptomyces turgidiscabies]|uniref:hypothetical protein n=1 Tax=Streptomyces turgidiscabies TaxID=85558 RepID=UPI0038F7D195
MTGPENYCAAERLLDAADEYDAEGDPQTAAARRTEAVARAVLALTAAVATHHHPDSTSWDRAINPKENQT